jgi:purine nucleoside phosphorylase
VSACALDVAVASALSELAHLELELPAALIHPATGAALFATRLERVRRLALIELAGTPAVWSEVALFSGELAGVPVWLIEDAPGSPEQGGLERAGEPAWARGFPVWLAAAAGAGALVHTSAGVALAPEGAPSDALSDGAGSLLVARDHLNLSGRTPLLGLADSELGPLFPDCSALHDAELRERALESARTLSVAVREGVVACVAGPALETPAERRFWARAGADVAVQELQNPLLAAAHARLPVLELVCVTDSGDATVDMRGMLQRADALAPALDELIARLVPALAARAQAGGEEEL